MDRLKANVAKSKSSNSAITTRSERRSNKECRSEEFQPRALRRRGVYVDKKPTKSGIDIQSTELSQTQVKAPPRPRPGKKRFLASVFTILSKSTASTQCPEFDDAKVKREKTPKFKKRKKYNVEQTFDKNNHKYKSRVLNGHNNERQKVVILKSKKDIVQTPSNSESCRDQESTRWLNLPTLVKQEPLKDTANELKENLYDDLHVDVVSTVMNGRKLKESRVDLIHDDPKTLVSEETKESGLYNFFVNVLESTFNVYNVKPQYDGPSSDLSVSKVNFVIDEKVAKKLDIRREKENKSELFNVTQNLGKQYYLKNETDWSDGQFTDMQTKPIPKVHLLKTTGNNRRLKSKSFACPNRTNQLSTRSRSPNRSVKKNKKKDLMNILKDELKMEIEDFEEPNNLFQALQVIARNKRKCKKSIRFDESVLKNNSDSGDPECIFKRRNVISIKSKSTKKKYSELLKSSQNYFAINKSYNDQKKHALLENTTAMAESNHTLKVYGVDYQNPFARTQLNQAKDIDTRQPYHSSPSDSDIDFDTNDFDTIMNFSASGPGLNLHNIDSNVLLYN